MRMTGKGATPHGGEFAQARLRAPGWLVACALAGVAGYAIGRGVGAGFRPPPCPAPGEIAIAPTVPAAPPGAAVVPTPASAPAAGAAGDLDPPPPMEQAEAFSDWKLRHREALAQVPPRPVPADAAVGAAETLRESAERERGVLVATCWNAQAPEDLEGGTMVKVVATVDATGAVGDWEAFEVPETRRPELVECVRRILEESVKRVPAPERPVSVATLIQFP